MTETNPNQERQNDGKSNSSDLSWLKDLGIQSWQAELAISGLVFTGLFQASDFFIHWLEPHIIRSSELEVSFLKLASTYILIGIKCLSYIFGFHLFLRGIWVALLGLNSAYPDGVNVNSENGLGKKQWIEAKEKYPNLTIYNADLDKNCSVLFSIATLTIITAGSFAIIIILLYYVFQILTSFFPFINDNIFKIGITFLIVYIVFTYSLMFLTKRYPDNTKINKLMSNFNLAMGSIFTLHIFRNPVGYISAIYSSNVSKNKYRGLVLLCIMVFLGFQGGRQLEDIEVAYNLNGEKYFTFNNKPNEILNANYENLKNPEAYVYTPIIQSDIINDDFIKLFIPTIKRENIQFKNYSVKERFKMNAQQKLAIKKEKLESYKKFNRIFLNEIEYTKLDFQFYNHAKGIDEGLMVYIPTDSCHVGKNILEIRKNYYSKDSVQKIVKIPFQFSR